MVDSGYIRKLDNLGRIVLPMEIRKANQWNSKTSIEFLVDHEKLVLRKHESGDIFTGETEDLVEYRGKLVSKDSIRELVKLL